MATKDQSHAECLARVLNRRTYSYRVPMNWPKNGEKTNIAKTKTIITTTSTATIIIIISKLSAWNYKFSGGGELKIILNYSLKSRTHLSRAFQRFELLITFKTTYCESYVKWFPFLGGLISGLGICGAELNIRLLTDDLTFRFRVSPGKSLGGPKKRNHIATFFLMYAKPPDLRS